MFSSQSTFYGIGGARNAVEHGGLNVGFVLYGVRNDEAATLFRELGNEAGVIAHLHDLIPGIQNYGTPLVLWSLIIYETLQGSAWLSQVDSITENPAMHSNPFTASVETLKRLLARNLSRGGQLEDPTPVATKQAPKRSTERGEGRAKLIAALTKHHEYADSGCLNTEPIGNNGLARMADVSASTASEFFNKEFNGLTKYRAICADKTGLVAALKLLNQEFSPHLLFGAKPLGEGDSDE